MKKDLKEAILGIEVTQFDGQKADLEELVNPKQLEEIISDWMPEVLSQEWLEAHTYHEDEYDFYYADPDELKNLLVPKQEKVKIDKEDAKNIEQYKSMGWRLTHLVNDTGASASHDELLARAWLDGYTVDREQKYVLSINITDKASKTKYETFLNKRGIFHSMENDSFNSEEFNWTEEEIKNLESGEILFEHFAVKVEELEE